MQRGLQAQRFNIDIEKNVWRKIEDDSFDVDDRRDAFCAVTQFFH